MAVDASKFSLDFLKPTESSGGNADYWENAALRVLQSEGKQNVDALFKKTAANLAAAAPLGTPELDYDAFAAKVEEMINKGKLKIVRPGTAPTDFEVSLPGPA